MRRDRVDRDASAACGASLLGALEPVMAVCDLGLAAGVHLAVDFFRQARGHVRREARGAGGGGSLHVGPHSQPGADATFILRRNYVLRNVPAMEEHLSIGNRSRGVGPYDRRQPARQMAAPHARRDWIFDSAFLICSLYSFRIFFG